MEGRIATDHIDHPGMIRIDGNSVEAWLVRGTPARGTCRFGNRRCAPGDAPIRGYLQAVVGGDGIEDIGFHRVDREPRGGVGGVGEGGLRNHGPGGP